MNLQRPHRRLTIALVQYRDSAAAGGSLRVGEAVANHLDSREFDPHLVFAYGRPGPVARASLATCHFVKAHGPGDIPAWMRARQLITTLAPDVIHYMDAVFWMRAALLGCRTPSLVHVHGPIHEDRITTRERLLWGALPRVVSGHVCITRQMRETVLRQKWARPESTWVIPNGIDVVHFANLPERTDARLRYGIDAGAFVFGMVCRLVPEKGCEEALETLALLPARFHLLIAGSGPLRMALEARAASLGITSRVYFTGHVNDARHAYAAMDALLFMSRQEPFGLVIAEAMAAGVPVTGLAGNGGYREPPIPLVTAENSSLLERPARADFFAPEPRDTVEQLAAHLIDVTAAPDAMAERARIAQAWVRAQFDISLQTSALQDLYTRLAA